MRLTISNKTLVRLAATANAVADIKSTMPVLACAMLATGERSLSSTATDLYMAAVDSGEADVMVDGAVCVDAKSLLDRASRMPEGDVLLELIENTLHLKTHGGPGKKLAYKVSTVPASEFPPVKAPDVEWSEVSAVLLMGMLRKVLPFASLDTTRANLNAVQFEVDGSRVLAITTNGHACTVAIGSAEGLPKGQYLMTIATARHLAKMCDKREKISLALESSKVHAKVDSLVFSSKLVDARFPPWRQVVKEDKGQPYAKIGRDALAFAVNAVSLASTVVHFSFSRDRLEISAEGVDSGEAVDGLDVEYTGPDMTIGIDSKYIMSALAACDSGHVLIGPGADLPCHWKPANGSSAYGVIMPIRT